MKFWPFSMSLQRSSDALSAKHQAEKLEPQPQELVAFGFLITN
jgi:hypothetical protein